MVAARSDPALEALPTTASDEARALTFAKSIARIAVCDWEGVGDADGTPVRGATIAPRHGPQCGRSGPPALSTLVIPCSARFTSQVTLRFTIRAGLQDFSPRQSPLGGFR
jgi:hypothetical protein